MADDVEIRMLDELFYLYTRDGKEEKRRRKERDMRLTISKKGKDRARLISFDDCEEKCTFLPSLLLS